MWGKPSSELSVGNKQGGTETVVSDMLQAQRHDKKTDIMTPTDSKNLQTVHKTHMQVPPSLYSRLQQTGEFDERNATFCWHVGK